METKEVQTFVHEEFGRIRTVIINSTIYFVGKDVARAIGYVDTKSAIRAHVAPQDKMGWQISTPSRGLQAVTVINENGLFSLILESELPRARAFRHWMTSVVLPNLRATGSFVMSQSGAVSPPLPYTPSTPHSDTVDQSIHPNTVDVTVSNDELSTKEKVDALIEGARLAKSARLRNKFLHELLFLITGKQF